MSLPLRTAVWLAAVPWCAAQQVDRAPLGDDGSAVEIESVFSLVPPCGYAPVRVSVTNNAGADRSVTLNGVSRAAEGRLESSFTMSAPARKTTTAEFMVPLCAATAERDYFNSGSLRLQVHSGGMSHGMSFHSDSGTKYYFTAFSKTLADRNLPGINAVARSSGAYGDPTAFAGKCDPAHLPSDWRGFSGLDVLALTSDDWLSLQPGVRTAIRQWVQLGGTLDIYRKAGAPDLAALGVKTEGRAGNENSSRVSGHALGRGRVRDLEWNGSELDASNAGLYAVQGVHQPRCQEIQSALRETEGGDKQPANLFTPLMQALGVKSFAAWQVGLILLIFGIVVGPVNLFYFARAGRRHRLFFTTPLIALAASVLLLMVIFLQDGTGGNGHRASVVYLDSAENTACIHQYQVSRTGVLFGGSFATAEPAAVSMALLPPSRWTRLRLESRSRRYFDDSADAHRYTVSGSTCAGDWFQSRTEQAQILDSVQSTRGRLELKLEAGVPVVTSTFNATLERVFYVNDAGRHWASPGSVTTGAPVKLAEATEGDFNSWRSEALAMLPAMERSRLTAGKQKNFFFASSRDPRAGMVDTLGSIRWESDAVFVFGPLRMSNE